MFEIEKERLDSHEVRLEVTFEDEAVQQAMRSAAREISREIKIPGFRKGRAPYGKVVRTVGESVILQEAAEHLLQDNYPKILEEADVEPYGPGDFENMETDPLTFTLRVPLQPTVELGDYETLSKEWEEPTVSDEEMEQVFEQIREEHAVLEPVERPAEMGDELYINVVGTADGDVIVDEEDIEVVLSEEQPFLSEEFVRALVGATAGETVTTTLPLPETVEDPALRGVETDFEIEVTQVYERELPELDDALASTVGSFETFEELREDVHTRIIESKQQQTRETYRDALVDELIEMSEVEYPPAMLEDTLDDMMEETREQVKRRQQMELEDALRLQGQTVEQFRENLKPQADQRVKRSLVLSEFARAEGVEVSDDEVVQEYSEMMTSMGLDQEAAQQGLPLESRLGRNLRYGILGRKTLERLEAIGRGLDEVEEVEEAEAVEEAVEETEESATETEVEATEVEATEVKATEAAEETAADEEASAVEESEEAADEDSPDDA